MLWYICLYKRHFSGCCYKMPLTIFLSDRLSCHVTHLAWTDRNIPWRSMTPWRWSSAQKKWRNYQQSCQYVDQCRRPKKNSSNFLLVKRAAIAVCFARQIVNRPRTESTRECNWPVRDATVNYRGHVIYIWSDLIGWTHAVRTRWFSIFPPQNGVGIEWWHYDGQGVHTAVPCKTKRQYLLTLQVSRYCLLALQDTLLLLS